MSNFQRYFNILPWIDWSKMSKAIGQLVTPLTVVPIVKKIRGIQEDIHAIADILEIFDNNYVVPTKREKALAKKVATKKTTKKKPAVKTKGENKNV